MGSAMTDDRLVTAIIMGLVVLFILATIVVALVPRVIAYRRSQLRWRERQRKRQAVQPVGRIPAPPRS